MITGLCGSADVLRSQPFRLRQVPNGEAGRLGPESTGGGPGKQAISRAALFGHGFPFTFFRGGIVVNKPSFLLAGALVLSFGLCQAVANADIIVDPVMLDFGDVVQSDLKVVFLTLSNDGDTSVSLSPIWMIPHADLELWDFPSEVPPIA